MKDYKKEAAEQECKNLAELKKKAPKFPVPKGFTAEWREGYRGGVEFVMKKEDDVEFVFYPGGDGTTRFKVDTFWLTFDRTGVESSFYWKPFDYKGADPVDLEATYKEHFERIAKRREYQKTAIKVPEIGYSTSPAGLVKLKEDLKTRGYVTFTPSGFGTGYNVTKCTRHGKRASAALEKFFDVTPLFIETMDCD